MNSTTITYKKITDNVFNANEIDLNIFNNVIYFMVENFNVMINK